MAGEKMLRNCISTR